MSPSGARQGGPPAAALVALAALHCACGTRPPAPALAGRIVCLGDSLTAGYTLDPAEAWPALLQQRLRAKGLAHQVVNAGVSGETSAQGLSRLDPLLAEGASVLVLALGANDGLRGQSLGELKHNLASAVERAGARGVPVLLCGMRLPSGADQAYARDFAQTFHELAREKRVAAFLPFLLDGVAGDARLNLEDGLHPNAVGMRMVAENVWRALEPLLEPDRHAAATRPR